MVRRALGTLLVVFVVFAVAACTTETVTWEEPPEADLPSRPDDEGRGAPDPEDEEDEDDDRREAADEEEDDADEDHSEADDPGNEVSGIPAGHMPPPGSCRIWYPDRPPGQQPPPGSCSALSVDVPAGAWLLYRPTEEARVYRID